MNYSALKSQLGKIDIYLLDQIMKNRYSDSDLILDAGCGNGRNLEVMNKLGLKVYGCDKKQTVIEALTLKYPNVNFKCSDLKNLNYDTNQFDHIICNAVLHFAKTQEEFSKMLNELYRVLKTNGTLFIRMTSIFGLENLVIPNDEQFLLPDNSHRFLLTQGLVDQINTKFEFIEPLKTVNVNNLRCMSTLVLKKV